MIYGPERHSPKAAGGQTWERININIQQISENDQTREVLHRKFLKLLEDRSFSQRMSNGLTRLVNILKLGHSHYFREFNENTGAVAADADAAGVDHVTFTGGV